MRSDVCARRVHIRYCVQPQGDAANGVVRPVLHIKKRSASTMFPISTRICAEVTRNLFLLQTLPRDMIICHKAEAAMAGICWLPQQPPVRAGISPA